MAGPLIRLYLPLLLAAAICVAPAGGADPNAQNTEDCSAIYRGFSRLQLSLQQNSFAVNRDLNEYRKIFGAGFSDRLKALGSGRWLDGGAGAALAQRNFLKESKKSDLVAIAYRRPLEREWTPAGDLVAVEGKRYPEEADPRFRYLEGRYLEEIPGEELGKFRLITDYFGPASYSPDFPAVLNKYFEALEPDGEIFLGMDLVQSSNLVQTEKGEIDLMEWLAKVPGIKVEMTGSLNDGRGFRIRSEGRARVPELELLELKEYVPPKRRFRLKP